MLSLILMNKALKSSASSAKNTSSNSSSLSGMLSKQLFIFHCYARFWRFQLQAAGYTDLSFGVSKPQHYNRVPLSRLTIYNGVMSR